MSHPHPKCNRGDVSGVSKKHLDTLSKGTANPIHLGAPSVYICVSVSAWLLKEEAWRVGENTQSLNPHVLVSSFEMLTET